MVKHTVAWAMGPTERPLDMSTLTPPEAISSLPNPWTQTWLANQVAYRYLQPIFESRYDANMAQLSISSNEAARCGIRSQTRVSVSAVSRN